MDQAVIITTNALVSSYIDYCNSLFRNLSSFNMDELQYIQNTLARTVTNCMRYSRPSPILRKLHWLQVEFCFIFKIATLIYKFLHSGHPNYFSPLLSIHCGTCGTRYFGHSFAFDSPTAWNDLPDAVCSATTLACFRKNLKSYLFKKDF